MARDKRRNSEKRKEKSRDAARCRRGKESEIFSELAQCLPLAESVTGQLDKASVMRLSISMLKMYSILKATNNNNNNNIINNNDDDDDGDGGGGCVADKRRVERWDHLYQKALEGFAFILSQDGDIVYLSESVGKYLGLQQIELIGQSIYDFAHPCDHEEIREMLMSGHHTPHVSPSPSDESDPSGQLDHEENKSLIIRLKCTLTSKGRNVNLKSATYKPMKLTGRLLVKTHRTTTATDACPTHTAASSAVVDMSADSDDTDSGNTSPEGGARPREGEGFPFLVGVAEHIAHPSNIEVPLDSRTFLSKHSMDMRFLFCDDRIEELAGFNGDEMIGQSIYDFHHGLDCETIEKAFKDLFSKGQTVTDAYRFLAKEGGYMWVVTQATVINNSRTLKPQSVVCVHYVVSGIEQGDVVLSHIQQPAQPQQQPQQQQQQQPQKMAAADVEISPLAHLPPKVELSTENIFVPKTKDMDEAYFIPPELKDTITMLDKDPADLSYLAPNAGDDFLPVVFPDRDALLSPNPYNLKQEPDSSADVGYRKNLSPASILSSNSSSRIGSPKEYLNMPLPGEVVSMDSFFQSMNKLNTEDCLGTDDEEKASGNIDFSGRAPYIPMDSDQDLGLCPPTSGVLFTISEDFNPGLFGQTEHIFGPKQSLFEEPAPPPKLSIQDMLGGSTAVASIEQPADTMYLQMKRPLDMNSLEKGPPKHKMARLEQVAPQLLLEQVVPQEPAQQQQQRHHLLHSVPLVGQKQQQQHLLCAIPAAAPRQREKQQQQHQQLHNNINTPMPLPVQQQQQQQPQHRIIATAAPIRREKQQRQQQQQQHLCTIVGMPVGSQKQQQQQSATPSRSGSLLLNTQTDSRTSKDSVLLNLLLSGEERNYGYKIDNFAVRGQKKLPHQLLLPNLTTQECEVNAPASATHLLQGRELLSALEVITQPGMGGPGGRLSNQQV